MSHENARLQTDWGRQNRGRLPPGLACESGTLRPPASAFYIRAHVHVYICGALDRTCATGGRCVGVSRRNAMAESRMADPSKLGRSNG